jgi:hypothetical protein
MKSVIEFIASIRTKRREQLATMIADQVYERHLMPRIWRLEQNIEQTVREAVRQEHERMRKQNGDTVGGAGMRG